MLRKKNKMSTEFTKYHNLFKLLIWCGCLKTRSQPSSLFSTLVIALLRICLPFPTLFCSLSLALYALVCLASVNRVLRRAPTHPLARSNLLISSNQIIITRCCCWCLLSLPPLLLLLMMMSAVVCSLNYHKLLQRLDSKNCVSFTTSLKFFALHAVGFLPASIVCAFFHSANHSKWKMQTIYSFVGAIFAFEIIFVMCQFGSEKRKNRPWNTNKKNERKEKKWMKSMAKREEKRNGKRRNMKGELNETVPLFATKAFFHIDTIYSFFFCIYNIPWPTADRIWNDMIFASSRRR